jgi:hypothetical protein
MYILDLNIDMLKKRAASVIVSSESKVLLLDAEKLKCRFMTAIYFYRSSLCARCHQAMQECTQPSR